MIKPAIEGGKPERKDFLVFGKPKISKLEIKEVIDTLKSGWIGTGPKTKLFEQKFKTHLPSTLIFGPIGDSMVLTLIKRL